MGTYVNNLPAVPDLGWSNSLETWNFASCNIQKYSQNSNKFNRRSVSSHKNYLAATSRPCLPTPKQDCAPKEMQRNMDFKFCVKLSFVGYFA